MEEKNKKVSALKTVSYMTIIVMLGKVLGLFRDILIKRTYGTQSIEMKAFTVAEQIPSSFLDIVFASALSASFIPVFNEYLEKKGKQEAFKFSNNFINVIFIVASLISALGILLSPYIMTFFAGYDIETINLSIKLLRIIFPTIIFTALAFTITGILQSLGEFLVPSAISIISNIIIIIYLLFFIDDYGIVGLAFTYLLAWSSQLLVQLPSLKKKGYKHKIVVNFNDKGLKNVINLTLPVMVSTWLMPINLFINTSFASHLYDGAATVALQSSNQIFTIIVGVIALAVSNLIFPDLSRLSVNNDADEFANLMRTSIKSTMFVLIPIMFGLMILAEPIVRLLFENGKAFTAFSTKITAKALFYNSFGVIGYGLLSLLNKGFYAFRDGKALLITSVLGIAINYTLSTILMKYLDIGGLTLSSSISMLIVAILLFMRMKKKFSNLSDASFFKDLLKMFLSACLMAFVVYFTRNILLQRVDILINRVLVLILPTISGIVIYFASSYILKIEEIRILLDIVKSILKRGELSDKK